MTKCKFLLTSSGIVNDSIQKALVDLLGKPIGESSALFVPTAIYAYPGGIKNSWQVMKSPGELGWKAFGVLELTALPSLPKEIWLPQVEDVDAISDEMRAVVESEWPELVHKLPPKERH